MLPRLIGLTWTIVWLAVAAVDARELYRFKTASRKVTATIVSNDRGSGAGYLLVEFAAADGRPRQAQIKGRFSSKSSRKMGPSVNLFEHKVSGEVRLAGFFAFYFTTILYFTISMAGVVLLVRLKGNKTDN